jgi:hypothetical protein
MGQKSNEKPGSLGPGKSPLAAYAERRGASRSPTRRSAR